MLGWGDDGDDVTRGVAADWCPDCDDVRAFSVEEKMIQYGFLGLAVGRPVRAKRRRVCWECGWWKFLPTVPYPELVSVHEAERMRLRRLAEITNPDLYDDEWGDDRD